MAKTMPGLSRLKSMGRFRDRDVCRRKARFVRAEILQCGSVFSVHETEGKVRLFASRDEQDLN